MREESESRTTAKASGSERACDACRIRKLKCPSLLAHKATGQPCARCIKTGLMCTYDAPPKKRGPTTGRRLVALGQLKAQTHQPQSESPPSATTSSSTSTSTSTSASTSITTSMTTAISPLDPASSLWHAVFQSTPESERREVLDFFHYGYAAFPILDRESTIHKLDSAQQLADSDFRCLLLATAACNEACKLRSDPLHGEVRLLELVRAVEHIRTQYDFAEAPTLDTIATSIFLFVAYSVSGRHKRAFLYLTEAIGLFDMVDMPSDDRGRIRLSRIEYVLFVTESATTSIYGTSGKRKLARRPINIVQSAEELRMPGGQGDDETERLDLEAMDLLLHMTRLHSASDMNEIISIGTTSPSHSHSLFGGPIQRVPLDASLLGPTPYCTQYADVAITRQWMLANQLPALFTSCQANPLAVTGLAMILQDMGASVMQWIAALQAGQIRVVGLGKVTAIAQTIHRLSAQIGDEQGFGNVLKDLVFAVGNNDHEQAFTPLLSECFAKFYVDPPPVVFPSPSPPAFFQHGNGPKLLPPPPTRTNRNDSEFEEVIQAPAMEGPGMASGWTPIDMWETFDMSAQPGCSLTPSAFGSDIQFQPSITALLGF